jgi:hypothetical protein
MSPSQANKTKTKTTYGVPAGITNGFTCHPQQVNKTNPSHSQANKTKTKTTYGVPAGITNGIACHLHNQTKPKQPMESQRELHVTFTGKQNQNNPWSPSGNYMSPSKANKTKTTRHLHRQTKTKQPMESQRELQMDFHATLNK